MTAADERFDDIHAALVAFEAELPRALPADMMAFGQARLRLAKTVNEFLAGERERANDLALLGVADAGHVEQQALYKALVDLRLRYSSHIARWNNQNVLTSWSDYRHDAMALIAGLRRLIRQRGAVRASLAA